VCGHFQDTRQVTVDRINHHQTTDAHVLGSARCSPNIFGEMGSVEDDSQVLQIRFHALYRLLLTTNKP